MKTLEQIVIASILLAMGGCAAAVDPGPDAAWIAAPSVVADDALDADAEPTVDEPSAGDTQADMPAKQPVTEVVEVAEVELSLDAVDAVSGDAIEEAEICRVGFQAPRGFAVDGSHAPAMTFVDDQVDCGEGASIVPEHAEVLLAAHAPGYPFYVVHMTSFQDDASVELNLLTDAQLDHAYEHLGQERESFASSILVDTPAAGMRVTLVPVGYDIDDIAPSTYLDADGELTHEAVDGGKALFTNVAVGPYEVRFEHDRLRCATYGANGWRSPEGTAVWALDAFEAHVGGIVCNL